MGVVRRVGKDGKVVYCIRYYGPDGRQRWETIGPNRKEAATVLHQRIYEVRSGRFPILRRHTRVSFSEFADEWLDSYATAHVRPSTLKTYKGQLTYQLRPAFGHHTLGTMTTKTVEQFFAEAVQSGRLAPKTANNTLVLLKSMLAMAVEWGYLATNPAQRIRLMKRLRQAPQVWTIAETRKFLLAAEAEWRPLFLVALFTGLREGELQALAWDTQNRPNFVTNKLEVSCAYDAKTKMVTAPKSDRSIRTVDMVPAVRRALLELREHVQGPLVFPGDGGVFSRSVVKRAYLRAIARAEVGTIRLHSLRHVFASLLIMAGKHPKYISSQMGHHSAAFSLDTYGHLMDRLPVQPVEWIDDLVFPEGFEAALKLHLYGAPSGAIGGRAVQRSDERELKEDTVWRNVVQSGAGGCMVGGAGFEPATSSV